MVVPSKVLVACLSYSCCNFAADMKKIILPVIVLAMTTTTNAQNVQNKATTTNSLQLVQEWDKTFPKSDKVRHEKVTFRNRFGITLAWVFTLLSAHAQTRNTMNDSKLTTRQLNLATCAALEAQGDMTRLDTALRKALDEGVIVNELKEAFSQLYAYTGFPRSLNALNQLKSVLDERKANREIVTVAALSAMKGVERQLASHKRGAVMMGNTAEQVEQLCFYLSENGLSQSDHAADACHGEWPKGDPNTHYAHYFTGNSHLAPIAPKNLSADEKTIQGYSNVTFEPGCRNNWHIHHGAHQILICVSGKGWYQEWGKPAISLKAGDIIDIPDGVKHWHGAQQDSWFQHLATHVSTSGNETNEWLEAVDDKEYQRMHQ